MRVTLLTRRHVLLLVCTICLGCSVSQPERPFVLVTVPPQGWLVDHLAGDWVESYVLVPPGAHPGSYAPGQRAMRYVSQAELYLTLGNPHFPFERVWVDRIPAQNANLRIRPASDGEGHMDPHMWTSLTGTRQLATVAAKALIELLPAHEGDIRDNLADVLRRIDTIQETLEQTLAQRPGDRFYVFHPAWGAAAEEWGLEQVAIEEEGKEPSPNHLANVVQQAREDSVRYILVQPQFSQHGAQTVAEAIGAELLFLDPLQADWPAGMAQFTEALAKALVHEAQP